MLEYFNIIMYAVIVAASVLAVSGIKNIIKLYQKKKGKDINIKKYEALFVSLSFVLASGGIALYIYLAVGVNFDNAKDKILYGVLSVIGGAVTQFEYQIMQGIRKLGKQFWFKVVLIAINAIKNYIKKQKEAKLTAKELIDDAIDVIKSTNGKTDAELLEEAFNIIASIQGIPVERVKSVVNYLKK